MMTPRPFRLTSTFPRAWRKQASYILPPFIFPPWPPFCFLGHKNYSISVRGRSATASTSPDLFPFCRLSAAGKLRLLEKCVLNYAAEVADFLKVGGTWVPAQIPKSTFHSLPKPHRSLLLGEGEVRGGGRCEGSAKCADVRGRGIL